MSTCSNPGGNVQLQNACACQQATNNLATALTFYENVLDTNNATQATYNAALQQYNSDHATWQKAHDAQAQQYNISIQSDCGLCGSNPDCPSGYQKTSTNGIGTCQTNCVTACLPWPWDNKCTTACTAGCSNNCEPTQDNINGKMAGWLQQNPEPLKPPAPVYLPATPPTGNNIECCSQLFQGINASSVNFSNITQQCNQQITNQITTAQTPAPASTPAPTSASPTPAATAPAPTPAATVASPMVAAAASSTSLSPTVVMWIVRILVILIVLILIIVAI